MKSILISVKPKYCELIANGKKTVEVRKTKPKLDTPFKVYIYCTKDKNHIFCPPIKKPIFKPINYVEDVRGNGKVIGEFLCDRITEYECSRKMKRIGVLNARPNLLQDPPQSWCYVESEVE